MYEQPEIPGPGYLWTPGYWAYGPEGYYWVPGTWVQPPAVGLLWTPGYWGWSAGVFVWNTGYWGPQVGFYGGVNYGFGYGGHGYEGGYWRDNQFYYNRNVTRINDVHITNVYNKTVVNNVTVQRVSYVGGPGGTSARPTAEEQQAARLRHAPPTPAQTQHRESAATHHELLASVNQGKPQIAATAKPGDFSSHVVPAKEAGGPMPVAKAACAGRRCRTRPRAPADTAECAGDSTGGLPGACARPAQVRARTCRRPRPPRRRRRNQARDNAAMQARHDQERENLAKQQEQDHAKMTRRRRIAQAKNSQAMADLERQHQQQTQQLQQRHAAEAAARAAARTQVAARRAPHRRAHRTAPPQQQQSAGRPALRLRAVRSCRRGRRGLRTGTGRSRAVMWHSRARLPGVAEHRAAAVHEGQETASLQAHGQVARDRRAQAERQ